MAGVYSEHATAASTLVSAAQDIVNAGKVLAQKRLASIHAAVFRVATRPHSWSTALWFRRLAFAERGVCTCDRLCTQRNRPSGSGLTWPGRSPRCPWRCPSGQTLPFLVLPLPFRCRPLSLHCLSTAFPLCFHCLSVPETHTATGLNRKLIDKAVAAGAPPIMMHDCHKCAATRACAVGGSFT